MSENNVKFTKYALLINVYQSSTRYVGAPDVSSQQKINGQSPQGIYFGYLYNIKSARNIIIYKFKYFN